MPGQSDFCFHWIHPARRRNTPPARRPRAPTIALPSSRTTALTAPPPPAASSDCRALPARHRRPRAPAAALPHLATTTALPAPSPLPCSQRHCRRPRAPLARAARSAGSSPSLQPDGRAPMEENVEHLGSHSLWWEDVAAEVSWPSSSSSRGRRPPFPASITSDDGRRWVTMAAPLLSSAL